MRVVLGLQVDGNALKLTGKYGMIRARPLHTITLMICVYVYVDAVKSLGDEITEHEAGARLTRGSI